MTRKSRATLRSLVSFYATPDLPTQDEQLAAAARVLSERNTAEDRIDIKEHIRRYHGGHLEPGESCPFLDKIKAAEEEFCTLDPKDADGDGNADFQEEEETEEGMNAEVSEDSAIRSYFDSVAKDSFKEEDHPRTQKGGSGGGRFAKKPETMKREDDRDMLSKGEAKNILLVGLEHDTDSKLNDMLGDTKVIPVHHTISDLGLLDAIAESRRSGHPIVAQAISEWRKVCKELLAKELEKGGFTCIAYAGKCPCGQGGAKCRCTNSQIDRYNSIALNRDELGKVFKIVDVGKPTEEK